MFLESIRLKNFRTFNNHELSFVNEDQTVRKTTILLGENGTGKTNLLKAIGLVTAGRSALGELIGDPDDWIQIGKKRCELEAVLVTKAREKRQLKLRIDRGDELSAIIDKNRQSLKELDEALEHTERSYFVLGYGVSRQV